MLSSKYSSCWKQRKTPPTWLEFSSNIDQFFILSPQIIRDVSCKTRLEATEIQAVPYVNLSLKNLIANKEIAETNSYAFIMVIISLQIVIVFIFLWFIWSDNNHF